MFNLCGKYNLFSLPKLRRSSHYLSAISQEWDDSYPQRDKFNNNKHRTMNELYPYNRHATCKEK